MKKLYIGAFFLFGIITVSSQQTLWQKDIQSSTQDFLTQLSITIDGQYLVAGSSMQPSKISVANQNMGYDFHVMKLNQQGQQVWEKYYSGNSHDYLSATVATQEGGFLLAGSSYSTAGNDKVSKSFGGSDIWLLKTDEEGNEQWQKSLGTKYNDDVKSVTQTTDMGSIVIGNTNLSDKGFGGSDVVVYKLDKNGKVVYQKVIGGTESDEIEKVIPTKDGGCLIGIYSQSGKYKGSAKDPVKAKEFHKNSSDQNTDPSQEVEVEFYGKQTENYGVGDYWIIKLDKKGTVEWENNFGGREDDHLRHMALTENGYVIGGESRSESSGNKRPSLKEGTDLWLVTLNEDGTEKNQYSYNFGNRDILMSMDVIKNREGTQTKGYLLGGYTMAEGKKSQDDEKFWMLYIDEEGKEEWRKYVEGKTKKKEERLVSAKLQNDGSFILAGTSADELGAENWKIVKLGDKDLDDLVEKQEIRIYPNPVEDYCYVEIGFPLQDNEEAEIMLHDMSGRKMQTIKTKNKVTKINTAVLPQGVYVVTATTASKVVNTKIVKK